MNPYARPNAYRENSIMTASPEQLVVMLYDGAGRFLRQAEGALLDGSWLLASEKLSRAEAIIDELLATLDMDAGEVADRLQSIYVFCKSRLIEARIERDSVRVDQVARLLAELRDAWSQVRTTAVA
jgi:flagellar protein FliS